MIPHFYPAARGEYILFQNNTLFYVDLGLKPKLELKATLLFHLGLDFGKVFTTLVTSFGKLENLV